MLLSNTLNLALNLSTVLSSSVTENQPDTLAGMAIKNIHKHYKNKVNPLDYKIVKRVAPDVFNPDNPMGSTSALLALFNLKENFNTEVVDLSNLNLERIPLEYVKKLTRLRSLDLSNNTQLKFNEEWFQALDRKKIDELLFADCDLRNEHIEMISEFSKLKTLDISKNLNISIQTETFKRILKNLTRLIINECELTASDFQFICKYGTKLKVLMVNGNSFNFNSIKGSDRSFTPIATLQALHISNSAIAGISFENFLMFPDLRVLNFSGNDIQFESLSDNIACSSSLKILELKECTISKPVELFNSLGNFARIRHLDISKISLKNHWGNISFGNLINTLKCLNVTETDFDTQKLIEIAECPNLEILLAATNNFESLNEELNLKCRDTLIEVDISNSSLNHLGAKAFLKCPKIQNLNLSSNNLNLLHNGSIPVEELSPSLEELYVQDCDLTAHSIELITNFRKLEILEASQNNFFEFSAEDRLGCSKNSLICVNLVNSFLNINGLKAFTDCPLLEELDVSSNTFKMLFEDQIHNAQNPASYTQDDVGLEFGSSKDSLKLLFFNGNVISYDIIKAIGSCTSLKSLTLNQCQTIVRLTEEQSNTINFPTTLEYLSVENAFFIDLGYFKALKKCKNLEYFDARDYRFNFTPNDETRVDYFTAFNDIMDEIRAENTNLKLMLTEEENLGN